MTESTLDVIRTAVVEAEEAKARLRAAIADARQAGMGVPAIAEAAGVTRQRVYQILRETQPERETLEARLADLDERWECWIDRLAPRVDDKRYVAGYAAVTRFQNTANGKSVKRGRGKVYKDVRPLIRDLAESELLLVLEHRGDQAVVEALGKTFDVDAVRGELDEAAALRKQLATFGDTDGFFDGV